MTRKIDVVPYDSKWPNFFEEEAKTIQDVLRENCIAVHHIGSTSVPELCAKPKIDIIAVVKDTALVLQRGFEDLGYQYKGEFNIPFHLGFSKRGNVPDVNLHVYEEGNPEIELNLLFRDFLRDHPEARENYGTLKLNLVTQDSSHKKINCMFSGYNLGKDAFIKQVLDQASFSGLCMRLCTHYDEWEAARTFRQIYFFDRVPVVDPYTWTFDHQDHAHLVLYQGTEIVGYVHLQFWKNHRAALRIVVIDERLRDKGRGGKFLALCERWLKEKGFVVLQAQSSPEAYLFFCKRGYIDMPFNDPDGDEGCPQDMDVGKIL